MEGDTLPHRVAEVEVAIIGAGPAGCAAAIELARYGREVLVIDGQTFPRSRPCGGCLSGPTTGRLKLLLGPAARLPGTAGTRATVVVGRSRLACHPRGATRIVRREELDVMLAHCAATCGAELRCGETAALAQTDRGWEVEVGGQRIRPQTILLACGPGGLGAKLGLPVRVPRRRILALQWTQPVSYATPPAGGAELHWLRGGRVLLATPHEGLCTVALTVDASQLRGETVLGRLRRLNPHAALWRAVPEDAVDRFGARGAGQWPWCPRVYGQANLLLIGDAAGCSMTLPGEGIGLALTSAACARQAILEGGPVLRRYTELMHSFHRPLARRNAWIGRLLQTRVVQLMAGPGARLARQELSEVLERVHIGTM